MAAVHIRQFPPEPAGGGIDKSGIIQFFANFIDHIAFKLPPAFIENGPVANTGVVFQLTDRSLHALQELFSAFQIRMQPVVCQLLQTHRGQHRISQEAVIAVVDHILEDDHAQLIALIVKFFRFYFDMLAQGVEAQTLHGQDVLCIAFRFCGSKNAVGPVTLIQQAMEEIRFTIETQAGGIPDFSNLQGANCKVRIHPIFFGFQRKFIQIGVFRTPKVWIFRCDGDRTIFHGETTQVFDMELTIQFRLDRNGDGIPTIFDVQLLDILLRYAFQPHRLPNARYRCVPHTATLFRRDLLAVGIGLILQIVHAANAEPVTAIGQRIGDVQSKGFITALMAAHGLTVEKHVRALICRADVQQHSAPVEAFRQGKTAGIIQQAALFVVLTKAGQLAFRAERYANATLRFIIDRKIPNAVQIDPVSPAHLGTGVDIPRRFLGSQQFRPPGG